MKLRQIVLSGFVARVLLAIAYRKTEVPEATTGHAHRFFSFYLTKALSLRTAAEETIQAVDNAKLVLWVVPPGMFHEWVGQGGTVWDLTPLHRPHQLSTP